MRPSISGLLGIIFLCGFTSTLPTTKFQDNRDNIRYTAVTIGDLQVMTKNLQFQSKFAYCYDNLERYCNHFGKLYDYRSVVDREENIKERICPEGWQIPTLEDWKYLILGMKPTITRNKEGQLIYHISENYPQLQFGGFRSHKGGFYFNMAKEGHYMTSTATEEGWSTIKVRRHGKGYNLSITEDTDKNRAISCRCIRKK